MSWRSAIIVISCAAVVMVGAAAALAATFGPPWDDRGVSGFTLITPSPPLQPGWEPGSDVLAAQAGAATGTAPGALADALAAPLAASALGGSVGASVVDLTTATPVLDSGAEAARAPASTLKILTAVAALHVLGPEHTFATRVVTSASGLAAPSAHLTLVGGGDPTLTADASGGTRLGDLADLTVEALTEAGVTAVELAYDASLFSGPAVDPDWRPSYVPSDIVSPVTALGVDVAEDRPDDPPSAAAAVFADLLEERGISVSSTPVEAVEAVAGDDATPVAALRSAPVSTIIEDILATSDNDGAEVIARHVALGSGLAGSSEDASAAIPQALDGLGIDVSSTRVLDGSGLARASAVPAAVITDTLVAAADPAQPRLRAAVTGLPVAGFSGTLADRLDDSVGAGVVRAKTGTLTGISALAGVVTSADGGSYVFAVLADDVSDTLAARSALDDVAAAIAGCGCG